MPVNKDYYMLTGSSGQSTGYTIDQSIRFNDDNSSLMSRTPSQASSSQRAFTISFWTKRGNLTSGNRGLFAWEGANDNSELRLFFDDNQLRYSYIDSNSYVSRLDTIKLFRDVSAWYHIVAVSDTENAVATERWKIYVNGVRETAFENTVYPSQNANIALFSSTSYLTVIGRTRSTGTSTYDGYLSEINVIDGYAYDPSYFGEFKTDTDIWIPKEYEGSYGNNGFYLKGQNSGALGNDSSGNDNDFSVTGLAAHDQVLDSPTNNFAVINPLIKSGNTLSEGNLKVTTTTTTPAKFVSTIGVTSRKWFMEFRHSGDSNYVFGVTSDTQQRNYLGISDGSTSVGIFGVSSGSNAFVNGSQVSWGGSGTTWSSGDIIGLALNADDSILEVYKNGSSIGSYDYSGLNWSEHFFAGGNYVAGTYSPNFGQEGTFAGNISAGGNSDSNGVGDFKYSDPSGYLALCTKNLGS